MTAKERARLARLEAENARLREQLAKQSQIYREQRYEIVDLRIKIDLITSVLLEIFAGIEGVVKAWKGRE